MSRTNLLRYFIIATSLVAMSFYCYMATFVLAFGWAEGTTLSRSGFLFNSLGALILVFSCIFGLFKINKLFWMILVLGGALVVSGISLLALHYSTA